MSGEGVGLAIDALIVLMLAVMARMIWKLTRAGKGRGE